MGEIVDLEVYRKRRRRKASRPQGVGNRRNPDGAAPRPAKSSPRSGGPEPQFGETVPCGPMGTTKIENSDPKAD